MKVSEVFANFCDMCWFFFAIMCMGLFLFVAMAITMACIGYFGSIFWGLLLLILVYMTLLLVTSYWEAYSHWKRNNV